MSGPPLIDRVIEERHGSAGALRTWGYGGHVGAPILLSQLRIAGAQAVEAPRAPQPETMEREPEEHRQDLEPIDGRRREARRRSLREVARGHRNLADAKTRRDRLTDDLLVEDEAVGV